MKLELITMMMDYHQKKSQGVKISIILTGSVGRSDKYYQNSVDICVKKKMKRYITEDLFDCDSGSNSTD